MAEVHNPFQCFAGLPQLQAFIWKSDSVTETRALGYCGYKGITVAVKLNSDYQLTFQWPFPEKKEQVEYRAVPHSEAVQEEVIPINLGLREGELHAAIAKIGLGHLLINLKK
jgi:hypothetical protein